MRKRRRRSRRTTRSGAGDAFCEALVASSNTARDTTVLGVTSLVVAVPALVLARQSPRPHHGKLFVALCLALMFSGLVALAGAGNYRTEMTEAVEDHDLFDGGQACTAGCLLSLLGGVVAFAVGLLALALHFCDPTTEDASQVRASVLKAPRWCFRRRVSARVHGLSEASLCFSFFGWQGGAGSLRILQAPRTLTRCFSRVNNYRRRRAHFLGETRIVIENKKEWSPSSRNEAPSGAASDFSVTTMPSIRRSTPTRRAAQAVATRSSTSPMRGGGRGRDGRLRGARPSGAMVIPQDVLALRAARVKTMRRSPRERALLCVLAPV